MTEVLDLEVQETTDQERCLLQHVGIVVMNVRYHSDQKTIGLFIAMNVFRITSRKIVAGQDLAEEWVTVEMTEVLDLEVQETTDQERCLLQHVGIVVMNVRYHSDQKTIGLFIAMNVFRITNKINKLFLTILT